MYWSTLGVVRGHGRMTMARQGMRDLRAAGVEPLARDPTDSD